METKTSKAKGLPPGKASSESATTSNRSATTTASRSNAQRGNKDWRKACIRVVERLMKLDKSEWFLDPVDPISLGIPDYLDIVKQPMDLGTIRVSHRPQAM